MPISSSVSISLGQRDFPFSAPCVRLASTKPPLRPDAAQPIRFASIRTMVRSGLRSAACSAVHSPVYPPPMTSRSQVIGSVSVG